LVGGTYFHKIRSKDTLSMSPNNVNTAGNHSALTELQALTEITMYRREFTLLFLKCLLVWGIAQVLA
jgi:hypothetical protein